MLDISKDQLVEFFSRNRIVAAISGLGIATFAYLTISKLLIKRRITAHEQAVMQKREKSYTVRLSHGSLAFLDSKAKEFALADVSKALRMTLDYAMQDFNQEELFPASLAGSEVLKAKADGPGEGTYALDISHVQWAELVAGKIGFESAGTLIEYVVQKAREDVNALVFEIDRSQSRPKGPNVRFSIKS